MNQYPALSAIRFRFGFEHTIEHVRNGVVLFAETVKNLVPTEGLNYALDAAFRGQTQISSWYVALFEGNYTPVAGVTAATFPAAATECTSYSEATRQLWVPAAAASGELTNAASKAVFTISAQKNLYGLAMSSVATKGSTSGVLCSATRFTAGAGRQYEIGDVVNVTSRIVASST